MRSFLAVAGCLLGSFLLACATVPSDDDGADYQATTGTQAPPAPPAPSATEQPSAPPPPAADVPAPPSGSAETPLATKTFAGTLAAAPKVPFGGAPYCNYEVTLSTIAVSLTVLETGDVSGATVKDTVLEKTVGTCPYAPMKPAKQEFTFKSATKTATGTQIAFDGSATNQPKTLLIVDLVDSGEAYEATLRWKRTDQTGKLGWAVTTKVALK